MNETTIDNIRDFLENNVKERLSVCRCINSYDGSMDFCDYYDNIEELAEIIESPYELAKSIIYGDVTSVDEPVRCDVYGNLETVSESDLEEESENYIDEILNLSDSCRITEMSKLSN